MISWIWVFFFSNTILYSTFLPLYGFSGISLIFFCIQFKMLSNFVWFLPWLTCYLEVFHFQLYTNLPEIFVNVKFFCSHKIHSVWIESFQIWDFCYHPGLTHSKGSMCTWEEYVYSVAEIILKLSIGLIWLIA